VELSVSTESGSDRIIHTLPLLERSSRSLRKAAAWLQLQSSLDPVATDPGTDTDG